MVSEYFVKLSGDLVKKQGILFLQDIVLHKRNNGKRLDSDTVIKVIEFYFK